MTPDPAVQAIARLGMAVLFASAAVHTWRDPEAFRVALSAYRVAPERFVGGLARAVPAAEALAALAIALPASRAVGASLLLALLAGYSAAIGLNLLRGRRDIDCGCAGPGARRPLSEWLLVRNLALAGVAATCLVSPEPRTLHALDFATIALGTATGAGLYVAIDGLIENRARWKAAGP